MGDQMEPRHPLNYVWMGRIFHGMRRFDEALAELQKGMAIAGRQPLLLAVAGCVHGRMGMPVKAREILEELRQLSSHRYIPTMFEASILGAMGELDEAFRAYDRAVEERSGLLAFMRIHGGLETFSTEVRADPRFTTLLRKLRLDF